MNGINRQMSERDMIEAFPQSPSKFQGKLNMEKLIGILQHLIDCSQTNQHKGHDNGLNLIYVWVSAEVYAFFVKGQLIKRYPTREKDPGRPPKYVKGEDPAK